MIMKVNLVGSADKELEDFFKKHCGLIFPQNALKLLGMEISIKKIHFGGGNINLQIYKISSGEKISKNYPLHYQLSQGGIIMFDVTDKESLRKIDKFIVKIIHYNKNHFVPLILLGTNTESGNNLSEKISDNEIIKYSSSLMKRFQKYRLKIAYFQASRIDDSYVEKCFNFLIENLIINHKIQVNAIPVYHSMQDSFLFAD